MTVTVQTRLSVTEVRGNVKDVLFPPTCITKSTALSSSDKQIGKIRLDPVKPKLYPMDYIEVDKRGKLDDRFAYRGVDETSDDRLDLKWKVLYHENEPETPIQFIIVSISNSNPNADGSQVQARVTYTAKVHEEDKKFQAGDLVISQVADWESGNNYIQSTIVKYEDRHYKAKRLVQDNTTAPDANTGDWGLESNPYVGKSIFRVRQTLTGSETNHPEGTTAQTSYVDTGIDISDGLTMTDLTTVDPFAIFTDRNITKIEVLNLEARDLFVDYVVYRFPER